MLGDWVKKRVLIVVRTYPVPARKSVEASCTAAITDDGQWVRLFPVPYRLMDQEKRFTKWHWIDTRILRAAGDSRPESYKLDISNIQIGDAVGTQDGWRARTDLIKPLRRPSMCRIQRERDAHGAPTLGVFRPHRIDRLVIEPTTENWTDGEMAILTQGSLFERAPLQTLEKIPYTFRYEFRCGDVDCNGHSMMCTDWEMGQAYRDWRKAYGDDGWEGKFREKFETWMKGRDTHFFVGTIHQHPGSWIIVGLFYPPRATTIDLFDDPP